MTATYHATNFRNKVVNTFTGNTTTNTGTFENQVEIWSGARPAEPSVTPAGVLLATVTVANGSWSAPSAGISVLANPLSATGSQTGTAAFARIKDTSGLPVVDLSVGLTGSGADCILDSLSITTGGAFMITNLSMKCPEVLGTLRLNMDLRNKLVDQWVNVAGAAQMGVSGTISTYTGAPPATADAAATGTKLVDIPTGATSPWSAAVGGTGVLPTNLTANAVASGTMGYARWVKGLFTAQGSVGVAGSDFIVDNITAVSGNPVTLTECPVTF